jgi:hypothetical protein
MKTLEELQAATDDELRVMLAELCGTTRLGQWYAFEFKPYPDSEIWKDFPSGNKNYVERTRAEFVAGGMECREVTERLIVDRLPNYPRDLNACHEAREALEPFCQDLFAVHLCSAVSAGCINGERPSDVGAPWLAWHGVYAVANASPRAHTIALILTLQK